MNSRLAIGHSPVTEAVALELVETAAFGSRVTFERYGRDRR